jgi:hypothetical protein
MARMGFTVAKAGPGSFDLHQGSSDGQADD